MFGYSENALTGDLGTRRRPAAFQEIPPIDRGLTLP
jgi:hypothetical protein